MKRRMDLSGPQTLAVASQLAVVLVACVLIGIFGGAFLDERLGSSPLMLILGSILGTTAGIYSMWKTTAAMIDRFERKKQSGTER